MTFLSLALGFALQRPITTLIDPNEPTFTSVLSQLATSPTLFLQLTGSTFYRGKTTPIVSDLSWSTVTTGQKALVQVELDEYVNSVLVKRLVGDGDIFWTYDLVTHEYSATPYGGSLQTRPESYQIDLLNHLNWASSGPNAYLAKLLRQAFHSTGTYTSWMPGVTSQALGANTVDPVNQNVTYVPSPSDSYYLYDGSPKRSIVFEIVPQPQANGALPINVLQNIFLNQVEILGKYPKYTHWQITTYTGFTFSSEIFKPYTGMQTRGWQSVVGPKPVTN